MVYFILRWVFGLLAVPYWAQNESYDEAWDIECRRLLDEGVTFKRNCNYTAKFGKHIVWTSNHPYASFTKYTDSVASGSPSRLTRYRMKVRLIQSNFYREDA